MRISHITSLDYIAKSITASNDSAMRNNRCSLRQYSLILDRIRNTTQHKIVRRDLCRERNKRAICIPQNHRKFLFIQTYAAKRAFTTLRVSIVLKPGTLMRCLRFSKSVVLYKSLSNASTLSKRDMISSIRSTSYPKRI